MTEIKGTIVLKKNLASNKSVILNEGGARSSKSYSLCQLFIYRFFMEENKSFLIVRKTFPSLRISVYKMFIELLRKYALFDKVDINKTFYECRYKNNYLLFASVDEPVKIQSTEFNYIWMEEAEEFTFDDYITLKTRLSSAQEKGKVNQIFLSYNPRRRNGYLNKKVKYETDVEIIKSSYKNNKYLNENYKKMLEDLKHTSEEHYNFFTLGEYNAGEGIIYRNIKIVQEFPVTNFDETIYGLDFGYNCPTALLRIDIKDKVCYVTELLYERHLTNSQLINRLKELISLKEDVIYCDTSEPARIKEIYNAGFNAKESNKDVAAGMDLVKSSKIFTTYSNVNFIAEMEDYSYRKDRQGNLFDIPEKENDHLMDAMRYAIYSHSKRIVPNARFF